MHLPNFRKGTMPNPQAMNWKKRKKKGGWGEIKKKNIKRN